MKRILTLILLISAILPVHSQLLVRNNGNIRIGAETTALSDSLSSIAILGESAKGSGGYISFGQRKDVTIGESVYSTLLTSTRFLTTSDSRYKKNILPIEDKGRLLNEVTPVSYVLDHDRIASAARSSASTISTAASSSARISRAEGK